MAPHANATTLTELNGISTAHTTGDSNPRAAMAIPTDVVKCGNEEAYPHHPHGMFCERDYLREIRHLARRTG